MRESEEIFRDDAVSDENNLQDICAEGLMERPKKDLSSSGRSVRKRMCRTTSLEGGSNFEIVISPREEDVSNSAIMDSQLPSM